MLKSEDYAMQHDNRHGNRHLFPFHMRRSFCFCFILVVVLFEHSTTIVEKPEGKIDTYEAF